MAVITTDFNSIQVRNIDPHSPVTSENHNKLLKTFGNYKMYVDGFNIKFIRDTEMHKLLAKIDIGTAYVQYMVIEMTEAATLEVTEVQSSEAEYYIVLEYTYRAIKPVPIAYLKVIRSENYTPSNQLLLYKVNIPEWTSMPSEDDLTHWWSNGNLVDCRTQLENTPTWANKTYLRLDGQNQASANLKMDAVPVDDNDITNKAYVDNLINNHNEKHNEHFVRKNGDPLSDEYGCVIENIDIALANPYFKLSDLNDEKKGLTIGATSNYAFVNTTKDILRFGINGQDVTISDNDENNNGVKVEINSRGITGALWGRDVAEYFSADESITEMPEEGTCICVHHGKAVISDEEGDPSVIGCISYHPAYILGGTTNFEKEFNDNHKLPVAVVGQIKNVPYYSDYNLETGGLLVSGKNGKFKVISHFDPLNVNGCVIGKTMNSVYPCYGDKFNRVDVVIK